MKELQELDYVEDDRHWLLQEFDMCGCEEEHEVLKSTKDLLAYFKRNDKKKVTLFTYAEKYCNNDAGLAYILLNIIDNKGWIEHGISSRLPWLTKKGEKILDRIIEEIGD